MSDPCELSQEGQRLQVVGVIGAGECGPEIAAIAEAVGRELAQRQLTLLCGGLGGVMAAACRGAKAAGGQTIGILPGSDPGAANEWVDLAIATGMGEARNVIIANTAQVLIAIAGEYGTLSEIAFALRLGKAVIGLQTWQLGRQGQMLPLILVAQTPEEAVAWAIAKMG